MINGSTVLLTVLVLGYGSFAVLAARAVIRAELARHLARRTSERRRQV